MKINHKTDTQLDDALNECFESMVMKGESLDSCLIRHPEFASELKPLLETMHAARSAGAISPRPAFRATARYEFRKALYEQKPVKVRVSLSWKWAAMAASLGVFVLTSAGGVVAASSSSMPGGFLYQLKRNVENVQLTLTPSQSGKARLYASLADRRIREIVYSAEAGDVQLTESLTRQFTSDLGMVYQITVAQQGMNNSGDSTIFAAGTTDSAEGQGLSPTDTGFPGSKVVTPAVTTTIAALPAASSIGAVSPNSPSMTLDTTPPGTTAASENSGAPRTTTNSSYTQGTVTPGVITDPVLLKLLRQYSIRNVAELTAILDTVPASTRAPLLAALQAATSAYSQILGG